MGKTSWRLIQRALESLTSIGFEVHGAILNNLAVPTGRYGYYYYRDYGYGKSYYGQQPAAERPSGGFAGAATCVKLPHITVERTFDQIQGRTMWSAVFYLEFLRTGRQLHPTALRRTDD